jgi:hypothetical protein
MDRHRGAEHAHCGTAHRTTLRVGTVLCSMDSSLPCRLVGYTMLTVCQLAFLVRNGMEPGRHERTAVILPVPATELVLISLVRGLRGCAWWTSTFACHYRRYCLLPLVLLPRANGTAELAEARRLPRCCFLRAWCLWAVHARAALE